MTNLYPALILLQTVLFLIVLLVILKNRDRKMNDIHQGVSCISRLLTTPHLRGQVGEVMLEQFLQSRLPPGSFSMQYGFQNGCRADAVIHLGRFLVPVDSKFNSESMVSFLEKESGKLKKKEKQILLDQASDIAQKYINPQENTLNFALMYIPSEMLFQKLFTLGPEDLIAEFMNRRVIPVSPSGFYLYLQTVAYGLKGLRVEERHRKWLKEMENFKLWAESRTKKTRTVRLHLKNLLKSWDDMERHDSELEHMLFNLDVTESDQKDF